MTIEAAKKHTSHTEAQETFLSTFYILLYPSNECEK